MSPRPSKVLAEVGADLSRFKTAKHFASWLGLCPGTKISGGKVLSGATKWTANRAAEALKLAAASLRSSRSALGAYYRRLAARMDKPHAVGKTDLCLDDQRRSLCRSRASLL
ncbi:MAG: transposase [Gammaproteobacteria bacterium]